MSNPLAPMMRLGSVGQTFHFGSPERIMDGVSKPLQAMVTPWLGISILLMVQIVCLHGQGPAKNPKPGTDARSGQEWYSPPPLNPESKFWLLPVTAGRLVVPISPALRGLAVSKLAHTEMLELDREKCSALGVPFEADGLIMNAIKKKQRDVQQALRYMKRHPLDGSQFDNAYRAIQDGMVQDKMEVAHWERLKGRTRPYLVRAVAANDIDHEFYADLWKDSLTIVHRSVINNSGNDPLRSHASIGDIGPADTVKWPVVVYLEARPGHLYTRIHVLKLGY